MTLEVFYAPRTRATRALWMAEELRTAVGLDVVAHRVDLASDRTTYRAEVHPLGRVPAIRLDGQVIFESQAILLWLADRFPEAGLAPAPDDADRARYYQWMAYGIGSTEPAAFAVFLAGDGELKRARAFAGLAEVMGVLERALATGGPWVLGDRFSAADVLLGGQVEWAESKGWLADMPALAGYAGRVRTRPAFVAAQAHP